MESLSVVLLTIVAYKFAIVNILPAVLCSTLFGRYMDSPVIFLFLFGVVIVSYRFALDWNDRYGQKLSWIPFDAFSSGLVGCVLYFTIYIIGSLSWFYLGKKNQSSELVLYKKMVEYKKKLTERAKEEDLNILMFKFEGFSEYLQQKRGRQPAVVHQLLILN